MDFSGIVSRVHRRGQETGGNHDINVSFPMKRAWKEGCLFSVSLAGTKHLDFQGSSRVSFQFRTKKLVTLRRLYRQLA